MDSYGHCPEYKYVCYTYEEVIKFASILEKQRTKSRCEMMVQLALATETLFSLYKCNDTQWLESLPKWLPDMKESRKSAIKLFKEVLKCKKNENYREHIGHSLPKLYLDVSTNSGFFFLWAD